MLALLNILVLCLCSWFLSQVSEYFNLKDHNNWRWLGKILIPFFSAQDTCFKIKSLNWNLVLETVFDQTNDHHIYTELLQNCDACIFTVVRRLAHNGMLRKHRNEIIKPGYVWQILHFIKSSQTKSVSIHIHYCYRQTAEIFTKLYLNAQMLSTRIKLNR